MRYKPITIAAPDADLSDVLVRIKIDADTDIGAVCQADGYDVYFTTSSGSTRLPFSRLEWSVDNGAASGQFDVLCDIPVSGVKIRMYYGGITSTDPQNRDVTYADYYCVVPTRSSNTVNGYYQDVTGNTSGFNAYTVDVADGNFPFGSTIRTATWQTAIYCTIGQYDTIEFQSLFACNISTSISAFSYGAYRALVPHPTGVWLSGPNGYINSTLSKTALKNLLSFGFTPTTYTYTCADKNTRVSGTTTFTPDSSQLGIMFRSGCDFAEFRAKKTLSSKEMLRFQYLNLTEPENIYTIRKPSKRRRRSAIIDFI